MLLLGGAVAAAAALLFAALSLGDDDSATPDSTLAASSTVAPTTVAAGPQVSQRDPSELPRTTISEAPATARPWVPLPAFASDPGWRVYLLPTSGGTAPLALDLTTGAPSSVDGADASTTAVVPTELGPLFVSGNSTGDAAVLADGSVWTLELDGLVHRREHDRGCRRTGADRRGSRAVLGGGLRGPPATTGEGRPVIQQADARAYVVATDATLSRLGDGIISSLDRGRFTENNCTPDGQCALVFHGSAGAYREPALGGAYGVTAFDPTGRYAAFFAYLYYQPDAAVGPSIKLFDVVEGRQITELPDAYNVSGSAGLRGWSPDGRYYFSTADSRLTAIEAATGEVIEVSAALGSQYMVIGVA